MFKVSTVRPKDLSTSPNPGISGLYQSKQVVIGVYMICYIYKFN